MYSFSYLEPVCCSMSSSNCCFLTCIQISQEAGQVVWYSHLLKNFPQFIVIHTVKGFGIVNKAEIDVFLELSCLFNDPADVGNLILVPLPFLRPAWTSGSSQFTYCWSLAWRILSITLLACEMSTSPLLEWPKPGTLTTSNAGKDEKGQELMFIAAKNAKWPYDPRSPSFVFTQMSWKLTSTQKPALRCL